MRLVSEFCAHDMWMNDRGTDGSKWTTVAASANSGCMQ